MKRDFVVMLEGSTLFGGLEPAILEKLARLCTTGTLRIDLHSQAGDHTEFVVTLPQAMLGKPLDVGTDHRFWFIAPRRSASGAIWSSRALAKAKRRWSSPSGPKKEPGSVTTPASRARRAATASEEPPSGWRT